MDGQDLSLRLRDGRTLGYAEYGAPEGRPLLYCHGFPSSRLEGRLIDAVAKSRNFRVIAVDRPGYGLSDFQPGRRLLDWPDDVATLMQGLGVERFTALGVSGGGPYALACAWKIPSKITAVAVVCGLGPVYERHAVSMLRWPARFGFVLAQRSRWLLWLLYGGILARLLCARPQLMHTLSTWTGPPADKATLARVEIREPLLAAVREGLRQGPRGALCDLVLYTTPWSFSLGEIARPVDFWHGGADVTVPPEHTELTARAVPYKTVTRLPREGHFSLPIRYGGVILDRLSRRLEN
jgi:pimeloyl-ACP methyl ester carboxylesterase